MRPERFARVMEVLAEALEREPVARDAFLDEACGGDGALREEVESLLAADTGERSALDGEALDLATPLLEPPLRGALAGRRLGEYRLERLLGAGGMGEVYLAHDERLDRKVAVKVLGEELGADPRWRRRFLREARLASALDHPNVCTIHEVGEADGRAFLAMQLVEGRTLRELVGGRPLPPAEWVPLALDVAEALAAAHERGIVHRDVKATNVVVTPRGRAKVLDFGIARRLDEPGEDPDLTAAGAVLGTPASMSPEQASGGRADERSDVFSLGVLMYEMATGRPPFAGASREQVLDALVTAPHTPPGELAPALPPGLARVIDRALAKDPGRRTRSMAELIAALREAGERSGALPPARGSRAGRGRWIAAAVALALAVAAALALVSLARRERPRDTAARGGAGTAAAPFQALRMTRLTTVGTAAAASISPDGATIAYARGEAVATGYRPRWPAGRSSLWIEQLATGSALEIAPPADVVYNGTTFSPDGQHVYYTVTSGEHPRGALYRVPLLGGTPRRVLDWIQSPVGISPDGSRLAFVRHDATAGADSLVVASADGGEERVLARRGGTDWFEEDGPAWSPDGALVACTIGSDVGSTHLTVAVTPAAGGEPREVTRHRWLTAGRLAWSPDGGSIYVIGAEGSDATNVGTSAQLWRIALPGGETSRVTNDLSGYAHTSLALTRDGRSLVAVREDASSRIWEVELGQDGEPGTARPMTDGTLDGRSGLDWTPGGGLVYVARSGEEEDLWLDARDGAPPRRLTDDAALEQSPVVSPDGRAVLYTSMRSGKQQVWHLPLDGAAPRQLTSDPTVASEPSWGPDGRWLVFSSWRSGAQGLWRMTLAGEPATRLTSGPAARPALSPDGRRIACSWFDRAAPAPAWRLAVLPVSGGEPPVSGGEPLEVLPLSHQTVNTVSGLSWTPDGRAVVYADTPHGVSNVWRQPLGGGAPRQLTRFDSGQIFSLALSRDGRRVAVARGAVAGDVVLVGGLR